MVTLCKEKRYSSDYLQDHIVFIFGDILINQNQ